MTALSAIPKDPYVRNKHYLWSAPRSKSKPQTSEGRIIKTNDESKQALLEYLEAQHLLLKDIGLPEELND